MPEAPALFQQLEKNLKGEEGEALVKRVKVRGGGKREACARTTAAAQSARAADAREGWANARGLAAQPGRKEGRACANSSTR